MDVVEEIGQRIALWNEGKPQPPYTLELYPTMRCNLSCSFCDTTYRKGSKEEELSRERYLEIADEAGVLGIRRCYILGGGEPMVRLETTVELMVRLKENGIWGMMTTNGTIFPDREIERVVNIGWDEIHFSIDAPTPEVNDSLRGKRGVFAKNMEVIRKINEMKRRMGMETPRLCIHTVVTNKNYHLMEEMIELSAALGCMRVNFDYLIAYRPEQNILKIEGEERRKVPEYAMRALEKAREYGIESTLHQFLKDETMNRGEMEFPRYEEKDVLHATCLNPFHHLVINTKGFVSPCCVITGDRDDVKKRTIEEVWFRGEYLAEIRERMINHEPHPLCRNCSMNIIEHNENIRKRLI